jgi:hemolysin III
MIVWGGVLFTAGTLFLINDRKFVMCHAIWHVMVIGGTAVHYWAIWHYVALNGMG